MESFTCSSRVIDTLRALLRPSPQAPTPERVAVLVGRRRGTAVDVILAWGADNESALPEHQWRVSKSQNSRHVLRARAAGMVIVGYAHSHNPGAPSRVSDEDLAQARKWPKSRVGAVLAFPSGLLTWYNHAGVIRGPVIHPPVRELPLLPASTADTSGQGTRAAGQPAK